MKSYLFSTMVMSIMLVMAACNSEGDELVDYSEDVIDPMNEMRADMEDLSDELMTMQDEQEIYDTFNNEILPQVEDMEQFMQEYDEEELEYEETQELHQLHAETIETMHEGIQLMVEALELFLQGDVVNADPLMDEALQYIEEGESLQEGFDDRIDELGEEYDLEIEEAE